MKPGILRRSVAGRKRCGLRLTFLWCALLIMPALARADGILTGTAQITNGFAFVGIDGEGWNISGNQVYLNSSTNDFVPRLVQWQIVPEDNQALLVLTILAAPNPLISLNIPPCFNSPYGGSLGTFLTVNADCLTGAITFTSLLSAPCLSQGISNCPFGTDLQSGPFIASGELTGWVSDCLNCGVENDTQVFDVRVFGQGYADISTDGITGIRADYNFVTPEPSTLLLFSSGLSVIGFMKRRRHGHPNPSPD